MPRALLTSYVSLATSINTFTGVFVRDPVPMVLSAILPQMEAFALSVVQFVTPAQSQMPLSAPLVTMACIYKEETAPVIVHQASTPILFPRVVRLVPHPARHVSVQHSVFPALTPALS